MAIKKSEIAELIRYEGVDSKGFGKIAKLVMTDRKLEIGAKALYAYLCSYAGSENAAFPHRDKIFNDLKMCKTTYYKHLTSLTDRGYIKIERKTVYPFANTYIIVSRPPHLQEKIVNTENTDTLLLKGIHSLGYGTVPKLVMLDNRISYKAKALYAYLCSFAGSGSTAVPKRADILRHLNISLNTFQAHIHDLIACNYITVEHRHIKGRFASNCYILNDLPDEELGKQEIERRAEYQANKQQNKHTTRGLTKSAENNTDSVIDKSIKADKPVGGPSNFSMFNSSNETPSMDAMKQILEERRRYEKIIKENIEYDILQKYDDEDVTKYLDVIVEVLLNAVMCKEPYIRVKKREMPTEVVKSTLLKLNDQHILYVCDSMKSITTMPKNLDAYLLTALYAASGQHDLHYDLLFKHHNKQEQPEIPTVEEPSFYIPNEPPEVDFGTQKRKKRKK